MLSLKKLFAAWWRKLKPNAAAPVWSKYWVVKETLALSSISILFSHDRIWQQLWIFNRRRVNWCHNQKILGQHQMKEKKYHAAVVYFNSESLLRYFNAFIGNIKAKCPLWQNSSASHWRCWCSTDVFDRHLHFCSSTEALICAGLLWCGPKEASLVSVKWWTYSVARLIF